MQGRLLRRSFAGEGWEVVAQAAATPVAPAPAFLPPPPGEIEKVRETEQGERG
jgi:hypothetical protein